MVVAMKVYYKGYQANEKITWGKWKGARIWRIFPKHKAIGLTYDGVEVHLIYFSEFNEQVINQVPDNHHESLAVIQGLECPNCGKDAVDCDGKCWERELLEPASCPVCDTEDPFKPAFKECFSCAETQQAIIELSEIRAGWDASP